MTFKNLLAGAALAVASITAGAAAASTVLYDNGPADEVNAYTINFGYSVTNLFTLGSGASVTGVSFNAWNFAGDTTSAVDWTILNGAPGTGLAVASGTGSIVPTSLGTNSFGYNEFTDTFSIPALSLGAGTYSLELTNAVVASGDPAYWGESGGSSTAVQNGNGLENLSIPSESFQILGASAVPEPATWAIMLTGLGLVGAAQRRRTSKTALA